MHERGKSRARAGTRFGAVLGAAMVAQAALLIGVEQLSFAPALLALAASGLCGVAIARMWSRADPTLAMTLVTLTLGGLGMLCGTLLDERSAARDHSAGSEAIEQPAVPPCHAAVAAAQPPSEPSPEPGKRTWTWLLSWMNLLMLAACVPACLLSCPCSLWIHGVSGLGMFAGMLAGGVWLGPPLATWLGPSLALHLSMLAGMGAGTAITAAVSMHVGAVRP